MASSNVVLSAPEVQSLPADYLVQPAAEIEPLAVTASFNGAGAGSAYVPVLEILAPSGQVVARCPASLPVAAAGSADVSWFPWVGGQSSSGVGPPYKTLVDTTLTAPAASISSGGADLSGGNILEVWVFARIDQAFNAVSLNFQVNGDAGPHYDEALVRDFGGTAATIDQLSGTSFVTQAPGSSLAAGVFSTSRLTFPNYSSTTTFKTCEFTFGFADQATLAFNRAAVGAAVWRGLAAISSLTITPNVGNLIAGTRLLILSR